MNKNRRSMAIVYFSKTGNTKKAAKLMKEIKNVKLYNIKSLNLPKPIWLFLSLLPPAIWKFINIPIHIEPSFDIYKYDVIAIGFPKWGFMTPPISSFISKYDLSDVSLLPFMTYGGWDYERFYNKICNMLEKNGGKIIGRLLIKRKLLQDSELVKQLILKSVRKL